MYRSVVAIASGLWLGWGKRWVAFHPAWLKLSGKVDSTSAIQTQPPAALLSAAPRICGRGGKNLLPEHMYGGFFN